MKRLASVLAALCLLTLPLFCDLVGIVLSLLG